MKTFGELASSVRQEHAVQLDEMPGANMDTRAVHQHLKKQGWKLTRTSGSHDVFTHSDAKHHIPVPRHRQLKAPLIRGILKQANVNEESMLEDLRNWFSKDHPEGDWKRVNSKGEAIGPCAREPGEPKPKCMSQAKRASLTKKERANAVATKRKHDPNPERKGAPINVSSYGKGKISEDMKNEVKNIDESAETGLAAKAEKSGISIGTLRTVYKRGVAAWNSGHRPGTTPQQWGMARVNSYIGKGKGTYGGADKDLHEDVDAVDSLTKRLTKPMSYDAIDGIMQAISKDAGISPKELHNDFKQKHGKTPDDYAKGMTEAVAKDKKSGLPKAYVAGLSTSTAKARAAHFNKADKLSDSDPAAYKPAPGDANAKTKLSKHTLKYRAMYGENLELNVEEVDPAHKKILDKAKVSVPKPPKSEYEQKVTKYLKKKYPQGAEFAAQRRKERLASNGRMDEEVKVGDKVSFNHPMRAIPGKTMKKVGTVGKIEGDTVHVRVKDKYGVIAHKKNASELTKEEVEHITELSKKTLGSYVNKAMDSAREMSGTGTNAEGSKKTKRFAAVSSAAQRIAKSKAAETDKKYKTESVEQIDEISDKTLQSYRAKAHTQIQHFKHADGKNKPEASSVLAKREPGMAAATSKVIQKNKERIAAQPKREPQKISSYKPLGGRDDNSGRSYSESVKQYDEEVKQTKNPDVPFDGPYVNKTTKVVTDKSGAKHTPMSRVKHLAKMAARKQAGIKEEEEKPDSFEKTNTQAKRTLSRTAGMVKDLANKAKSAKKAAPETFQAEPELSSQIVKV